MLRVLLVLRLRRQAALLLGLRSLAAAELAQAHALRGRLG